MTRSAPAPAPAHTDALARSGTTMLLTGNHATAWAARLARPQVVPVYPITPQTPILELLTDFQAEGSFDAEILTPESEHSVLSACIPASLAGARVFTATASQGLLLMHELLHYASGARAPIVMVNVNRTVAAPWAFWPDQTDSLAQRDTGWIQFYCESAQESLDTVIQAFRIGEQVQLPVLVNLDAFYVSHALEPVQVPEQQQVDDYLPPYAPAHRLDTQRVESWGNVVSQDMFCRHRQDIEAAMARALGAAQDADRLWSEAIGRSYGLVERYRCDGAQIVVLAIGSMCGTAREAVDALREAGVAVGLLKLRLVRPLPVQALRVALQGVPDVVVLDRNHSPGQGGILHQELRAALYGMEPPDAAHRAWQAPRIHGFLAGVGGVNVSPEAIAQMVQIASSRPPPVHSEWMRPQHHA